MHYVDGVIGKPGVVPGRCNLSPSISALQNGLICEQAQTVKRDHGAVFSPRSQRHSQSYACPLANSAAVSNTPFSPRRTGAMVAFGS